MVQVSKSADIEAALRAFQETRSIQRRMRPDLVAAVVAALYHIDGMEVGDASDAERAVVLYRSNPLFHRKVDAVVARVTETLLKNGVPV